MSLISCCCCSVSRPRIFQVFSQHRVSASFCFCFFFVLTDSLNISHSCVATACSCVVSVTLQCNNMYYMPVYCCSGHTTYPHAYARDRGPGYSLSTLYSQYSSAGRDRQRQAEASQAACPVDNRKPEVLTLAHSLIRHIFIAINTKTVDMLVYINFSFISSHCGLAFVMLFACLFLPRFFYFPRSLSHSPLFSLGCYSSLFRYFFFLSCLVLSCLVCVCLSLCFDTRFLLIRLSYVFFIAWDVIFLSFLMLYDF